MNLTASLSLTPKGVDEINNRVFKLSIRKRSVLLILGRPQTVEYILHKSVFQPGEIIEEIDYLAREGFIAVSEADRVVATPRTAPAPAARPSSAPAEPASGGPLRLANDIILSEAKFLLVDFCVDSFGTQSQLFVDKIGECKSEADLLLCLKNIYAMTKTRCPDRHPVLLNVIREINATA